MNKTYVEIDIRIQSNDVFDALRILKAIDELENTNVDIVPYKRRKRG